MTSPTAQKHYEKALKHLKAGKLADSEAEIAEAIGLDESQADYWLHLGLIWSRQERYAEAKDANQMALTLKPDLADAYYNMGLTQVHLGELYAGLDSFARSFALKPDKDLAEKIGDFFYARDNFRAAAFYYMKAKKIIGRDDELQGKLAKSLFREGDTSGAAVLYIDLVARNPTSRRYIGALVDIYRRFNHNEYTELIHNVLLICLKTENVKYRHLGPSWASMFLLNPGYQSLHALAEAAPGSADLQSLKAQFSDELICLGLENLPVLDIKAERILTGIRRYFLLSQESADSWPPEALDFLSALAVQGWYNDFVFYETAEEQRLIQTLGENLKALSAGSRDGDLREACLYALYGCYRPLYDVKASGEKLPLPKPLLYRMRPLIKAQIQNPEREAALIPTIPSFTEITDDVSRAVRAMYEKRPYPRWKSTSKEELPNGVGELSYNISVLVAGCGTGQEPALYANSLPHAKTTAVDLSLPSIAYGKRMAEEMGSLSNIDFMHGDLMEVGKIGRSFDFVVSSGVLHHLKDPGKGLQAILGTMKPGGRINISLYSKIARDFTLNPASDYIREKGYTSSDADMRQFRQDVIAMPEGDPRRRCVRASDFFMLSECNDLLFHVQEHRFTFLTIRDLAEAQGLELFHVYMAPPTLKKWEERYPGDTERLDYDRLHEFETENPDTFLEMYKVYFRRKTETTPHVLDPLIRIAVL